jgi:hypothetical protein
MFEFESDQMSQFEDAQRAAMRVYLTCGRVTPDTVKTMFPEKSVRAVAQVIAAFNQSM